MGHSDAQSPRPSSLSGHFVVRAPFPSPPSPLHSTAAWQVPPTVGRRRVTTDRSPRAALFAAVVLVGACGQADAAMSASGRSAPLPGTVVIDGTALRFRTTVCSAIPATFAATGRGRHDGESFVVTVRGPDMVVVKFGVDDELNRPPRAARWLYALGSGTVRADGERISGTVLAADVRDMTGSVVPVELDIRCPD